MEKLNLPDMVIPESCRKPSRRLTYAEYLDWVCETVAELKRTGKYEKIRNDPARRPADEPFVFRH